MQTLQITKDNAIKAYNDADDDVKAVMENLFGKENFVVQKITDRIKNFNDVLRIAGCDAGAYQLRTNETPDELAYRKIKLIAEVYNEGVIMNTADTEQVKYYPWFKVVNPASNAPGSGLSYLVFAYRNSVSDVGSRLCFKSRELAIYAGKQFADLYTDFFII